jgi:hypothetical protein
MTRNLYHWSPEKDTDWPIIWENTVNCELLDRPNDQDPPIVPYLRVPQEQDLNDELDFPDEQDPPARQECTDNGVVLSGPIWLRDSFTPPPPYQDFDATDREILVKQKSHTWHTKTRKARVLHHRKAKAWKHEQLSNGRLIMTIELLM